MWNIFNNGANTSKFLFEDGLNTTANVYGAGIATVATSIASDSLAYQKKLFRILDESHKIEDIRHENNTLLFSEILESINNLCKLQEKNNELLEELLQSK